MLVALLLFLAARATANGADTHANCEAWAQAGECDANPVFMRAECAASCSRATSYTSQIKKECAGYARQGECSRNPAFMLSTCRAECDAWEEENNVRLHTYGNAS